MRFLRVLIAIAVALVAAVPPATAQGTEATALALPGGWRHDGRIDEWRDRASTFDLVSHGAGGRRGRVWIAHGGDGLVIAGAVEGGAPRFATDAASMPAGDHVELWVSLADAIALPPIGWGHQFGPIAVPRAADCDGNVNIPDEAACRAWRARQVTYRRHLARLFVRQWQIAPGTVVETFAEPALAAMTKDEREAVSPLWRPDAPTTRFTTGTDGYAFEIVLPWEAMPAADRLDLAHVRIMVDVLSPGAVRRYGPLASTAPARRYGDMKTANRLLLDPPQPWRVGRCAATLAADDFYADDALPGYFLPRREAVLGAFFVLENRPQGYQYSSERPSPSAVRHSRFDRTLAPDLVLCGPPLAVRRGAAVEVHPDVEVSRAVRTTRVAGGFILMDGPATGLATRLGTGVCGACPRISVAAYFLPAAGGAPTTLFGESWIVPGENIDSPSGSMARIAVADDLRTIEVWSFENWAEVKYSRVWRYTRHCYDEGARHYAECAAETGAKPPADLACRPRRRSPSGSEIREAGTARRGRRVAARVAPVANAAEGARVEQRDIAERRGDEQQLDQEHRVLDEGGRLGREQEEARRNRDGERRLRDRQHERGEALDRDRPHQAEETQIEDQDRADQDGGRQDMEDVRRRIEPDRFTHHLAEARALDRDRPGGSGMLHALRRSAELGRLAGDRDALGAELDGVTLVRIAHHRRARPRLEQGLGQSTVLHPRRRRQDHEPGLTRHLEPQRAVRVGVGHLADHAGQRERLVGVVAAPAVMGEGRARRCRCRYRYRRRC